MEQHVTQFLQRHYDPAKPVLLALSGGPDSLALLHLLLRYRETAPLTFGIAHVDHSWREESEKEALLLQALADKAKLPFHLKKLPKPTFLKNLEEEGRLKRLEFYREICRAHGYQAVLLAHHADDQAETVLKRVLEGASLPFLCGLKPSTEVEGVKLWRPLLGVSKQTLQKWLQSNNLQGFSDATNVDPLFLRGRMRSHILPGLAEEFGKGIAASLERVGKEALELQDYMDERIAGHCARIEESPWGLSLDLSENLPLHRFELGYLIRKFCRLRDFVLSRTALETAIECVQAKVANKHVEQGQAILYIDRGRLFILDKRVTFPEGMQPLTEGQWGPWKLSLTPAMRPTILPKTGWREVWKGTFEIWVPEGEYLLGLASMNDPFPGKSPLGKWLNDGKVPAFMRSLVPVVWQNGKIFFEMLSGRAPRLNETPKLGWNLRFDLLIPKELCDRI